MAFFFGGLSADSTVGTQGPASDGPFCVSADTKGRALAGPSLCRPSALVHAVEVATRSLPHTRPTAPQRGMYAEAVTRRVCGRIGGRTSDRTGISATDPRHGATNQRNGWQGRYRPQQRRLRHGRGSRAHNSRRRQEGQQTGKDTKGSVRGYAHNARNGRRPAV